MKAWAFILGTVLILAGTALAVAASYGLIKETQTFGKAFEYGQWNQRTLVAELDLSPGDYVTFAPNFEYMMTPGKAFSISIQNNFDQTVMTQNFVVHQYEGFYPDIDKPFYLFTAQTVGRYRVYVSPISGNFSTDKFTFNVVVTRAGPYGVVVLLGLVVLAIGIISVVYSFAPIGKKSLPPPPPQLAAEAPNGSSVRSF